jgi:uncharacterized membrane protein
MDLRFLYAIILSVLPISELRGGLPLAILYAKDHSIPIFLIFITIVLANIIVIFFIFYFLDNLHKIFMNNGTYKKFFERHMEKMQKRIDKFEKKYGTAGFFGLFILTAVPIPVIGGAWTAVLVSWILDLDRKKSIFAISLGVLVAGIIVLLATLGIMSIFS